MACGVETPASHPTGDPGAPGEIGPPMSLTSSAPRTSDLTPRGTAGRPPRPARTTSPAAGRYRYDLRTDQWWWSPEVFQLHGLAPGSAAPTMPLLLAGVHPDDRERVRRALADACTAGTPFALEHRVLRASGDVRTAVLVGELETGRDGEVSALIGIAADVTDGRVPDTGDRVRQLETENEQLRTAMASRAAIEQAKGVLMLLMGCGDQVAFDLLAHISSHTHRKVRDVATAIVASASGGTALPADVRAILHDACPPGAAAV
jgi:ANTAR domain-containing protein/PAS domain-containing protein